MTDTSEQWKNLYKRVKKTDSYDPDSGTDKPLKKKSSKKAKAMKTNTNKRSKKKQLDAATDW